MPSNVPKWCYANRKRAGYFDPADGRVDMRVSEDRDYKGHVSQGY